MNHRTWSGVMARSMEILKQDGARGCSIDTEEALDVLEQAVHARLPEGSRTASVTLTTDNSTQFTSTRFIEH